MLSSFRKKINSVIQESLNLSENLSQQIKQVHQQPFFSASASTGFAVDPSVGLGYSKENDYSKACLRHFNNRIPRSINLNAGDQILEYNEDVWMNVHAMNVKNAAIAADIDNRILDVMKVSDQRLISLSDLNKTLANLPSIVAHLKTCTETIEEINSNMCEVEKKLMDLEDLIDVLELQEKQLDQRFEMALYKEAKMAELDKVREVLAKEHADNVVKHELSMKEVQKERQLVFQDAFEEDLNYYKEKGNLPIVAMPPKDSHQMTLEEVVLDEEPASSKDLNDFLEKQ